MIGVMRGAKPRANVHPSKIFENEIIYIYCMPYFRKKHILFIHIPKTGGTTVHNRFLLEDTLELYNNKMNYNNVLPPPHNKVSLQHLFYTTIYNHRNLLRVPFDEELRIVASVRNPYTRIVSDLFYQKLIHKFSAADMVYNVIRQYINATCYDNHNVPQYKFVVDEKGELVPGLIVLKMETLNEDLLRLGFLTTRHFNKGTANVNYMNYLDNRCLALINEHYKKDFELFGYPMITSK